MKDKRFLAWLHDRLCFVHGEAFHDDLMHKLRAIIADTPVDQETPNTSLLTQDDLNKIQVGLT
jgi:hypothetical protein